MEIKDVSRYVVSYLYGVDVGIIESIPRKTILKGSWHEVNYHNENGELIDSKVKIDGKKVIWGNLKGRWRTHERDSKLSYRIKGKTITITEKHFSGNSNSKTFQF